MKKYLPIIIVSVSSILLVIWINQKFDYYELVYGTQTVKYDDEFRYYPGDNESWANPDFDDSNWYQGTIVEQNNWWIRKGINLERINHDSSMLEIMIYLEGSYQLFWNGYNIGNNGRVGENKTSEIAGKYQNVFIIPDSLSKEGNMNQLALRVSTFHANRQSELKPEVIIGNYPGTGRNPVIFTAFLYLVAGIALLMSFYFLSKYFTSLRDKSYLLFALLCFSIFYFIIIDNLQFIYYYPYPLHSDFILMLKGLTWLITVLLPIFFVYYFDLSNKRKIFFLLAIVFAIIGGGNYYGLNVTHILWITGVLSSLMVIIYAGFKKIEGYLLSLVGILPLSIFIFIDQELLLPGFIALIIAIFYSDTLKIRNQRIQHERDLLHSNRLEAEILKQQIQPHFLMNTLTSLIDWLEEDPSQAPKLIHALAEEYKMLMGFVNKKFITVRDEIHLCRLHLTVMSFRKGVEYQLHTKNVNQSRLIPPAIFLTIIENGITHNKDNNGVMEFSIEERDQHDAITYSITSSDIKSPKGVLCKEGTGIKYIKARLEESFPEEWNFSSQGEAFGWNTKITLYNGKK